MDSDSIVPHILRGMGFEPKKQSQMVTVPILANQSSLKSKEASVEDLQIPLKQSAYFVPGWADTRWNFRKNITIDYNKVSVNLQNFPVLVNLYDPDLQQDAQASGNDIFFTDIQGNLLDHEIELYERVHNSSHAHLVAWVKSNLSSTQNTVLSMYYGNPIAENQESVTSVWDEDYVGVWHLSEKSGNAQDSTSYATSGGITGGVTQNTISQLGRGYDFDGTSGTTVDFGDPIDGHLDFGTGNFTISFWYNVDQSTENYQMPLYKGGSSNGIPGYEFETSFAGETLSFYSGDGTQTYSCGYAGISYDSWHYVVGMNDRLANYLRIYQDSVNIGNTDISSLGNVDSPYHLVLSPSDYPFDGMIDEVRLSKSIRSSAWIQAEYNNQYDPSTFYSVGIKENSPMSTEWDLMAYKFRKIISINSSKVSATLTDFPILVNLNDTDLHDINKVQADASDILFTDSSGTVLDHEIEFFDQTGNGTHAQLIGWVKVPTLSHTQDTNITMYYGNPKAVNQENPSKVWDSNYKGVWHLKEDPTNIIFDSTSYENNGTSVGMTSEDQEGGQIDGCLDFDGIDDYINMGDLDALDMGTNDLTIEAWIRLDTSQTSSFPTFVYKGAGAPDIPGYWFFWFNSNNYVRFTIGDGTTRVAVYSNTNIKDGTWHHVVAVADRDANGAIYIDGQLDNSADFSSLYGLSIDSTRNFLISTDSELMHGNLDEIRISNVARSADWILTEYNNQYDLNSFYSISSEEYNGYWWADASFITRKDIIIDKNKVEGFTDILVLRPEGVGSYTYLQVSGSTDNWEAVDEVNYDTNTYVYRIQTGGYWGTDYYQTEDAPTINGAVINSVTINYRAIALFNGLGAQGRTQLYINSQFISGDEVNLGSSYANIYSQEYQTNPATGEQWTWDEVNAMEIGVGLIGVMVSDEARATQVWAEVNYTVKEDLINFPLLLEISSSDLKAGKIQPDFDDLLFTDENRTKLAHEIEEYSQSASNGYLMVWIGVPILFAEKNTYISLYYGNSDLSTQENPSGVWNANYAGVWHLLETTGDAKDSTNYQTDGTIQTGATQGISGKIDGAYDFDGSNEGVSIGNPSDGHLDFGTGSFTISFWINVDKSTGTYQIPLYKGGTTSSSEGYEIETNQAATNLEMGISDGTDRAANNQIPITFDEWMYFVGVVDRTTNSLRVYKNGIEMGTGVDISAVGSVDNGYTMSFSQTSNPFDGILDEIRISTAIRSDCWIATEFSNQENPGNFYSIDSEEIFDDKPPTINDFGIDDQGKGLGKFWADISDIVSGVSTVLITINGTEYSMSTNGTHWIYQKSVDWKGYYEYQITNASDAANNYLISPSSMKNYIFTYDTLNPTVDDWDYFPDEGEYGTFKANVSDSWGDIDTVIVNVTVGTVLEGNRWAAMQWLSPNYINDTIIMNSGSIKFVITVNDTSSNSFTSSEHQGYVPIVNHFPIAENLTLSRDSDSVLLPIYSNCTLYLDYDFYDQDGDSEGGTEIRWYRNGILQTAYNDLKQVPAAALVKEDQWNATVKPKDGQDFGAMNNTATVTIQNTPPTLSNVAISPSYPLTTFDLSISYAYSDYDGDSENITSREIRWYNNSIYRPAYDNDSSISSTITKKGEQWYYEIRVHDGTNYSKWVTSTVVTIENTAPTASSLTITSDPKTGDDLIIGYSYADVDNDPENATWKIRWYKNNNIQLLLNDTKIVQAGNTSKGEIWYYTLQVYDGEDYSILYTLSPSIQILNTAPYVSGINITSIPKTTDDLEAIYTFNDVDGDSEPTNSWIIHWFKDGELQPAYNDTKTIPSSATTKGEEWNYTLKVYDGIDYSIQYNSSITTILNTEPTATGLTLTLDPKTTDDLVASWTFDDNDIIDSQIGYNITWYVNGEYNSTYYNITVIPASGTTKGEIWNYIVIVYDGTDYSIPYNSSTTTILNSSPTATGLTITPVNPTTTTSLVANWTFVDADIGDNQASHYIEWYRGTTHQPLYDGSKVLPSSATTKNQVWYFELIVNDGETNSTTYTSSSVEILNSPPVTTFLTLTPTDPNTSSTLVADWTFSDNDTGDSESTQWIVRWYKNGLMQSAYNDSKNIPNTATTKGEIWNYTVKVYDGTDHSIQYNSTQVIIINSSPTASGITITSVPTTIDDLVAGWTASDVDGDNPDNYLDKTIIRWFNWTGSSWEEITIVANSTTVGSGNTSKDEVWYYTLRVYDGINYSQEYSSPNTTILNSLPTVANPTFNKSSNVIDTDTLNITYIYADLDDDLENETARIVYWYKDGIYNQAKDNDTILDSSETSEGDIWQYIIQVNDGIAYSQNFSSSLVVIGSAPNTPPEAQGLTLTANSNTSIENLVADYSYYDANGHLQAGREVRWYKDGELQGNLNDSLVVDSSYTVKNEVWNYTLRVFDGLDWSIQYNSSQLTILNTPPETSDLTITSSPLTTNDLSISWIFSDDDVGDFQTGYNISWYVNGVYNSIYYNLTIIPASGTTKGEIWNYTLTVFDGENNSIQYISPQTTIINTAPTASALTLTEAPTTNTTLIASYTYSDADNDPENSAWIIHWYKNNNLQSQLDNIKIVNQGNLSKNDFWHYTLQVFDGESYSAIYTSPSRKILNTAPTLTSLTITTNPTTTSALEAQWIFHDNDSDVESTIRVLYWYKNGFLQPFFNNTKTIPSSATSKGEVWNYTIKVYDGTNYSIQYNSTSTTILNIAPAASDLTLTINPSTTDDLVANWIFSDDDTIDSQVGYNITWYINGKYNSTYYNLTTIPASATTKGEIWNYIVEVNDGTDYSIPYNSSTTIILNTAPTASGLTITPSPKTGDNLIAGYTYADADNDLENVSWKIRWYKNTILQPLLDDSKVVTAGNTSKGEIWYYTLQVYDGEDFSILYTLSPSIQILNTAPTATLTITSNPKTTNDLVASWTFVDIDGDFESGDSWILRWYKNGFLQPVFNDTKTIPSSVTDKGEVWNYTVKVSDGTDYSIQYNSSTITVLNSAPEIVTDSALIYIPPSGLYTTSTLVANWEIYDADGDTSVMSNITWWYKIGVGSYTNVAALNNQTEVQPTYTAKDQRWRFEIMIHDGTEWSVSYFSQSEIIANSEPYVENITLSGGQTTSEDIYLSYDYNDADGDPNNTIIQWKIIHSGSVKTISGSAILSSENITAGDLVWVVLTPNDGIEDGNTVDSSTLAGSNVLIQVDDTAPQINKTLGIPQILSDHPNGTSIYTAIFPIYVNYSDFVVDIDSIESDPIFDINEEENSDVLYTTVKEITGTQYRWYKYNETSGAWELQSFTTSFVNPYYLFRDEQWKVSVRPRDRYGYYGAWVNSTPITIGNSFPQVNGFNWLNQKPTTSDDLSFEFDYFDWDNDPMDPSQALFLWFKNGVMILGTENQSILSHDYFIKGDEIFVIIRPFDGTDWALINFTSPTVTIVNSLPVASNIILGPDEAYTTDQLLLNWTYSDIDGDNETSKYIIIWYNKGDPQIQYENCTSIPASATNKGDRWRAELRVHDGTNYSISYLSWSNYQSQPLLILNTKMAITEIYFENLDNGEVITNSTYANVTLSIDWNILDADNDGQVSFEIQWFENNGSGSFVFRLDYGYDKTEIPSSDLFKGHSWYVIIRVSDGEDWSEYISSTIVTIINTPPFVSSLSYIFDFTSNVDPQVRIDEFLVEDENLLISYTFVDVDNDLDKSKIQWFVNINGSWIERSEFENMTSIPNSETVPGERWYYILTPYDGANIWHHKNSSVIRIESRPKIHEYSLTAKNDTEGHYIINLTIIDLNEITSVEYSINDSISDTRYAERSSSNVWIIDYQLLNLEYLDSVLLINIKAICSVTYDDIDFNIFSTLTFNFTIEDTAPPRVESPRWEFDHDLNPTNITFYANIIEYGSEITDVVLYYHFKAINETENGGGGSSLLQRNEPKWREVRMSLYNSTNGVPTYSVTVSFDHNGTNREIIYRIVTTDSSGNSGIAYDILRDDPDRIGETRFIYSPPGINPTFVLIIVGITIIAAIFGSIVYVKFIRKPELIGFDRDLVMEKITEITQDEINKALDSHTIGIVVSFFDQRHGPIPIIVLPEMLRDNFNKLVELSDRSFSGTGFSDDFEMEIISSYDFVIAKGLRTKVISFGYALDRPRARGGQENLTANILLYQDIFPLVNQFLDDIQQKIHFIHLLMNNETSNKEEILKLVTDLRYFVTNIVLSYERIYGTTELIEEEK